MVADNWIQKLTKVRVTISVARDVNYIITVKDPNDKDEIDNTMQNKDASEWEDDPQFYEYLGDAYRDAVSKIESSNIQTLEKVEIQWTLSVAGVYLVTESEGKSDPDIWEGCVEMEGPEDVHVIDFTLSHTEEGEENSVQITSERPVEFTKDEWTDLVDTLRTFIVWESGKDKPEKIAT